MRKYFNIDHTPEYMHVTFDQPFRVLSSAVLNGGLVEASHIVNLKVPKDLPNRDALGPPAALIEKHCRKNGLNGSSVGMMTAAAMDSMRTTQNRGQDVEISVIVTAGISNLRRAGDKADYREKGEQRPAPGTINTIVVCNVSLTRAAMVEAVMIAAEAKAAALQDLDLLSPVSNALATGTGTDAIAVACPRSGLNICYAGKHTLFGELLAKSVIESTTTSVAYAGHRGG
ncbi:MAG: adenosylcobinamide amidohydrolase [Thermodesulfobacteriota bacterium]